MSIFLYIALIIAAYLLGSISNALWIGKLFYNVDVREHGSKNAGATNILRVLGWKAAAPVFILDFAKGVGAVCLILLTSLEKNPVPPDRFMSNTFVCFQIALGMAAVLGHIFPVFASFKGGKGVATIAGVILAIFPLAMLLVLGIFLISLLLTRYVSLSSIIAAIFFPFIVIVIFDVLVGTYEPLTLEIFSVLATVMILITHRNNIKRLRNGTEQKIVIRKNPSIELPKRKE
ncbi:MAG: glycerol-3-phosphate 1-O-acyltransferase PlsY [Prevotellaceae bacterium]|jgi:glycerol-3-phosphate acyltransferase PlsY|nr:glycerol-3-phosphate 1-O-acyltransferase PlsY [Prevotellaceae bacterium]